MEDILFLLIGILLIGVFTVLGGVWSGKKRFLGADQQAVVLKYFPFHASLPPQERERFERVTGRFLQDKEWQGAGIEIKEEMKVMISACAAQLLHGFDERITLTHFDRIIVFPDAFHGHRKDRYHQGEVNPRAGVIKISWAHFLQGYTLSGDAHNVGLHEMAHALWFEDFIPNREDGFLDPTLLQDWKILGDQEMAAIRAGKPSLLRNYAATNQEEFFAVAVEYFFERSVAFKAELPELYAVLSGLLKQDPLASRA
ncbi:MAG: zinc-dependent peptidase [Flavobacteriales bacterium]|nr:zinc-dependent peptidase [Flavobacteriales bacterium]